jgi:cytochrome c oxidase cbb3-type subunit 3
MGEKKNERVRWEFLALLLIPIGIGVTVWGISRAPREPEVPLAPLTPELLTALAADPLEVAEGKKLFVTACASCHGVEGQGIVGPNLTDGAWLHGSTAIAIHTSIAKGYPEKGMAPFENLLGPKRVRTLTAYVLSLKGKNVAGKPPEGKTE